MKEILTTLQLNEPYQLQQPLGGLSVLTAYATSAFVCAFVLHSHERSQEVQTCKICEMSACFFALVGQQAGELGAFIGFKR